MKYQFVTLDETAAPAPIRDTFMEAWDDMFKYVNELLNLGKMSLQLLETSLWIQPEDDVKRIPIFFYDARDIAIQNGWTKPL
jgi:hypothetical protein